MCEAQSSVFFKKGTGRAQPRPGQKPGAGDVKQLDTGVHSILGPSDSSDAIPCKTHIALGLWG